MHNHSDSGKGTGGSATGEPGTAEPTLSPGAQLARIRHDLKTPLNAILGYGEILEEDAEAGGHDALRPSLETVLRSGHELLALVLERVSPESLAAARAPWTDLLERAREPLRLLDEHTASLTDAVRTAAPEMGSDVEKIAMASRLLTEQLEGLAAAPPALATADSPEVPSSTADAGVGEGTRRFLSSLGRPDQVHGHVLVVDDSASNRDLLARRLDRLGYQVVLAASGHDALERMEAGHFDVILLDVLMPDMSGYEVLQSIKRSEAWRHVPVIMISALDEIESVAHCIEMGAEDYLPKPFEPVVLKARLGSSIEKKRLRDKELLYLRHVTRLTRAASALEAGTFEVETLAEVAEREDELGRLGRVFAKMAEEVVRREAQLVRQVAELRIEIDEVRKDNQVAEITDSDYFRQLQEKATSLRERIHTSHDG